MNGDPSFMAEVSGHGVAQFPVADTRSEWAQDGIKGIAARPRFSPPNFWRFKVTW